MNQEIRQIVQQLGEILQKNGLTMVTAESCTGGGIAQVITEMPGSSAWFDRAYVTYSNPSKVDMLQVKKSTLTEHGAVSEAVAKEMVTGALMLSGADLAVSVTGIAGPGGGTEEKPVGMVYIAWGKGKEGVKGELCFFTGDRASIRQQTIHCALNTCLTMMRSDKK